MNEKEKAEQIEKLKKAWTEEVLKLKPISAHNILNHSLNEERLKLEEKYKKRIAEIEEP